ncbi:MAG: hypothetical protein H0U65_05280 [Rubrobacter sp.]|jgi:hypothetical protein|nr:hypothetical protein [Rubrobacter sp.]
MDLYELIHEINWTHRITLKLSKDGDRVGLAREDAGKVPKEIKRAIKEHHDELLKNELLKEADGRLRRWMQERAGNDPDGRAARAAYSALGKADTRERLNDAWMDGSLEAFETALADFMRPGAVAFKEAASIRTREPEIRR